MKKYNIFFSEGSAVNQVICAVLINLPVFTYGAMLGWMSPMTLLLQSENSPRTPLMDLDVSWIASVAYLVCVPAVPLMAFLGDKFGRKITLMFISFTAVVVWVIKLSSLEIWAFITARTLVAISMAGCCVICPLYTKEISQDCIRGFLGSLVVLFQTCGNLLLYIIGDMLSYHTVLWICLTIPVVHLVLFIMMPESPEYLIKKGSIDEATNVIAWLRCRDKHDNVVKNELEDIKEELRKDEENRKFAFKAIVTDKFLFRAFRISTIIYLGREICGAIPVLNFAGEIFSMASKGSGLVLTPNQQAIMLGAVQVIGSTLASGLVEKTGRKPLLFITALISGLSMCVLASWFLARNYLVFWSDWIPIITLCICILCDSSGLQPLSNVIINEIFSFKYRSTVMSIGVGTAALLNFFQLLFFKPLVNAVGIHVAFYFFGGVCIAVTVYVLLVIPETKNRKLEVIYDALKTKKERRKEKEIHVIKEAVKAKRESVV